MPIINTVGTWLSNFQRCDVRGLDGRLYPSVEHAYQAEKSNVSVVRDTFRHLRGPSDIRYGLAAKREAKRLGLPPMPIPRRLTVMRHLLAEKFLGEFADRLLDTGDSIISEVAPWDAFWGTGPDGRGHDWLGKLIMERRSLILGAIEEIEDGGIRGI
jgi:predicted NAD-dependent protein-ADP-ribosyltransferase YbiA (DUF1768 family)